MQLPQGSLSQSWGLLELLHTGGVEAAGGQLSTLSLTHLEREGDKNFISSHLRAIDWLQHPMEFKKMQ